MTKQFVSKDGKVTATLVLTATQEEVDRISQITYLDKGKDVYRMPQGEGQFAYFNEDHLRALEYIPVGEGVRPSKPVETFSEKFYLDTFKYCGELFDRVTEDEEEEEGLFYQSSDRSENIFAITDVENFIKGNDTLEILQVREKESDTVYAIGDLSDDQEYVIDKIEACTKDGAILKTHFSLVKSVKKYVVVTCENGTNVAGTFFETEHPELFEAHPTIKDCVRIFSTRGEAEEISLQYRRVLSVRDVLALLREGVTAEEIAVVLTDLVKERTK